MTSRRVLLDGSFIAAVLDSEHPAHDAARTMYASLLDTYQVGTDQLFALSTVMSHYPTAVRRGALAPISTTWVARQHRSACAGITASSPEVALTLLMLRRERFQAIATAVQDFGQFDIEVLGVANDGSGRGADWSSATVPGSNPTPVEYVSCETEPKPVRLSMVE